MILFLNYKRCIIILTILFFSFFPDSGSGQNLNCDIYPENKIGPLMEICFPENWQEVQDGNIFHIIPQKRSRGKAL